MKRTGKPGFIGWVVVATLVATLTVSRTIASASISDCIDATCRISTRGGSLGTGCCFERSGGSVFILTNAHVVAGNLTVRCEFWRHGHLSRPLAGRVIGYSYAADAAIVAVPESAFGGLLPAVVPVAGPDCVLRPGQTVVSVGCANGTWPTGWKGHVVCYEGGGLRFVPPPADGRSGSAVFDAEGKKIVGLIRARDDEKGQGIATSVQALYRAFGGTQTQYKTEPCPGDACPLPPLRLFPFRQKQEDDGWRAGQDSPVWPTLPGGGSVQVDLAETNQKLDEISDLLKQVLEDRLKAPPEQTAPLVPVAPSIDGKTQQRLDDAEKIAQEAKQQAGKLQDSLSGLHQVVEKLTGDVETIPQRFEARLEKVKAEGAETAGEIARGYVRDLLAEKLSGGTLGLSIGKILSGALGLSGPLGLGLAIGLWFLSRRVGRRIESGEPLLVERLVDRIGDRLDGLRDRIDDLRRTGGPSGGQS